MNAKARKEQRKDLNKWNFFQFEQFLTYKAKAKGITIEYTTGGHTERGNRKFQSVFVCKHCSFSLNADLNASRNIFQNYLDAICHPSRAAVNPPIAPKDSSLVEQAQPS